MRPQIVPTILCEHAEEAKRRLALVEPATNIVQIDVMDGTLTPQSCWHNAEDAEAWKFNLQYELHLMVDDPITIIKAWQRVRGFTRALIQAETPKKLGHLIHAAKDHVREVGISISPGTSVEEILPFLSEVDAVQVMGGKLGKSGQKLDAQTLKTVRAIREIAPTLPIGFDIGVDQKTISILREAGVDRFCSAGAIFKSQSPLRAIIELQSIADNAAGLHVVS